MVSWKLFIDDERDPSFLPGRRHHTQVDVSGPWTIARTQAQACELIGRMGLPELISFDNDLGPEDPARPSDPGSGIGFARWLANEHLEGRLNCQGIRWQVHSRNPVEAFKIGILMAELSRGDIPFGRGAGSAFGEIER